MKSLIDLQGYNETGAAKAVLSAMANKWRRHPACRWRMQVGDQRPLGGGTLTVISPEDEERLAEADARKTKTKFDWNRLSTAMKLDWKGLSLVLGSDLVEKHGKGWTNAEARFPSLGRHVLLKAPHHGSREAPTDALLAAQKPKTERVWLVTPFSRQELPRFKRDEKKKLEGAELLLKHEDQFLLTGLPIEYAEQADSHRVFKRKQLAKLVPRTGTPPGFPDCWVEVVVESAGKTKVRFGPGSVTVTI
jgi:hypothetical protein